MSSFPDAFAFDLPLTFSFDVSSVESAAVELMVILRPSTSIFERTISKISVKSQCSILMLNTPQSTGSDPTDGTSSVYT